MRIRSQLVLNLVDELISEIGDIERIVNPRGRSLTSSQQAIMMKGRIFGLKQLANKISMDEDMTTDEKVEGNLLVIRELRKVLSYEPREHDLLFWYQLNSFHQLLVASVIMAHGKSGKLGIIGVAHALSDLLVGLNLQDPRNLLRDSDDPTKRMVALNIANGQVTLYGSLILMLPFLTKEEAGRYVEKIIDGMEVLKDIIETRDFHKLLHEKISVLDHDQKLQGAVIHALIPSSIAIAHYTILNRFNGELPEGLVPNTIFTSLELKEVFSNILEYFDLADAMLAEILDIVKSSPDYRNYDISNSQILPVFNFQNSNTKLITECFASYRTLTEEGGEEEFVSKYREAMGMLHSLSPHFSTEQFLQSSMGEAFESYLMYYIPAITLGILHTGEVHVLEELKRDLGVLLTEKGAVYFPRITLNFIVSKISVLLQHDVESFFSEIDDLLKTLLDLIEPLSLYPKETFATYVLTIFLAYLSNKDVEVHLKGLETAITNTVDDRFKFNIVVYYEYLNNVISGEDGDIPLQLEKIKWIFDPYSIIVPDFDKAFAKVNRPPIIYYPFNIWQEGLIQEVPNS